MEIAQSAAAPTSNTTTTREAPTISSDFETFLRLLTTQMQNQDPLNPMESTEFATQLATFSGVEQQVQTNQLLTSLQSAFSTSTMGQMSGWVGMDARAEMALQFSGEPLHLSFSPNSAAEQSQLVVYDSRGTELMRHAIAPGESEVVWAGVADDNQPLPNGQYRFAVEHFAEDRLLGTQTVSGYGRVEEARLQNGQIHLQFAGGVSVPADQVSALRAPGS